MSDPYFKSLNYTIGNEDTGLELAIMPQNAHHVFVVAGSGSRVIPLLAKDPHFITCVDSSVEQLSFTELKIASLKALDYKTYLAFWGYPSNELPPDERKYIFNNLTVSNRAKKITSVWFQNNNWASLLYAGRWEQTFQKLSWINRKIVGKKGLEVFACRTKEEQKTYLKTQFPRKAWFFSVFLLGNAVVFNALLYKGNFPKKNVRKSMHSFYWERFEYLFKQDLVRRNFFLQLLFFGKLQFTEGLPIECRRDIFTRAKKGLQGTQINYLLGDAIELAARSTLPIDFLSLSDISSYLSVPKEQEFLQDIIKNLSLHGIVVNRYYLRIPERVNIAGYDNITGRFKKIIAKEKIQMYSFGIYQKI